MTGLKSRLRCPGKPDPTRDDCYQLDGTCLVICDDIRVPAVKCRREGLQSVIAFMSLLARADSPGLG